jgi:hypothetical protein
MSGRGPHVMDVRSNFKRGARIVQIPVEWPAREGTVLKVKSRMSGAAVLIGWDDGRLDWIESADLGPLRISLVSEDEMEREPMTGPLETLLSKFIEGDSKVRHAPTTTPVRSTSGRVLTFPKGNP